MFTSRPFVLTSTLAATAVVLTTLSGPSAADSTSRPESESAARSGDASRTVAVRQVDRKPLGAAPSVAVVDPTRGTIGSGARRARYDEEMFVNSARAAGAGRYVVHSGNELYVAQHGAPARFLADRASRGYQVGGSRHDRVAYYENAPTGPRLTVRRLRDGDVVGRLGVPRGVTPLAYRGGRVWFARGDKLVTWSPGTGRVQRAGTPAPEALDLTAGAGVRYASDGRTVVFPLRAGAGWRPWRTSGAGSPLGLVSRRSSCSPRLHRQQRRQPAPNRDPRRAHRAPGPEVRDGRDVPVQPAGLPVGDERRPARAVQERTARHARGAAAACERRRGARQLVRTVELRTGTVPGLDAERTVERRLPLTSTDVPPVARRMGRGVKGAQVQFLSARPLEPPRISMNVLVRGGSKVRGRWPLRG